MVWGGNMGFKKFDDSTWQPINPKKLKGVPYSGTLPAVLTGTKAGYLHRYKIYGNTEQIGTPTPENPIAPSECGERTENKINTSDSVSGYLTRSGTVSPSSVTMTTDYIPITSSDEIVKFIKTGVIQSSNTRVLCVYDNDKNFVEDYVMSASINTYTYHFTPSASGKYYRASYDIGYGELIGVEGSIAPESYIPYGYKLPLTSAGQGVNIYIGDDTLSTEEYVDSGTGKIYRMVSGVLTPVDPPVPFPQIPTTANSTTISWAGEGLAPSHFDSIQEWVDIPTYTYTNGEWVEDN